MNKEFVIADCTEINKRKLEADKFYAVVFEPDEIPFIVTDEVSLGSLYLGDEVELINKVKDKYGIVIDLKHFDMPLWKLIDILEKKEPL